MNYEIYVLPIKLKLNKNKEFLDFELGKKLEQIVAKPTVTGSSPFKSFKVKNLQEALKALYRQWISAF